MATQPRTELLLHTVIKLWQRWPRMTDTQKEPVRRHRAGLSRAAW